MHLGLLELQLVLAHLALERQLRRDHSLQQRVVDRHGEVLLRKQGLVPLQPAHGVAQARDLALEHLLAGAQVAAALVAAAAAKGDERDAPAPRSTRQPSCTLPARGPS